MNILLLDKNIYYCKTLMNAISALNKEIRITFIANSLEDLSYIYEADVVLADYEFYGTDLEERFSSCNIIYLSDDETKENIIYKNNIDLIIKTIENSVSNLSEKCIENKLYSELILLGYDTSLLGTKCMLEALKIMRASNGALLHKSLISNIYPLIAEKLGISVNVVKSNINYATAKMLENANKENLTQYFGCKPRCKIGVKTVLHQILIKLN